MSQPREMNSVALTNHATNNAWLEVKPRGIGSANTCKLFSNGTEDIQVSLEPGTPGAAGSPNAADTARDANMVFVNAVVGEVFDFGSGVTEAIYVKKTAAAASDETVTCLY